ncbi:MAG: hypothetical protein Q9191_006468 [Dirinaria sp. TL-2023a]
MRRDGNDGPWSSFVIRVGTPAQVLRVLASTTVPETWIVSNQGCLTTDPTNCADSRGNIFNVNASSTWQDHGYFALGVEMNLPYTSNYDDGEYGFDTLGLGYPGSGSNATTLPHQVIASIATKDFYLGNLGLTPRPVNLTNLDNPSPSYLSSLKTSNQIPSLSYGYNAGAQYRLKKAVASLTLGGYDSSRFTPNDVEFSFASDISRDLVVGLQSIQFSDAQTQNKELLPSGSILTFIDSTIPHIWLPIDACKAFEDAFGITYDNKTELYLVNNTLHDTLTKQNANVSFIIANQLQGGSTVTITFPYAAFDLRVEYPIVSRRFLTVDYERSTFKVQPALWEANASQNITSILSVNASTPQRSGNQNPHKLSTGATAGIAVAAVVICLLILGAGLYWFFRKKRRGYNKPDGSQSDPQAEIADTSPEKPGELTGESKLPNELTGDEEYYGPGKRKGAEMEGSPAPRAEAPGSHGGVEMEGTRGGVEMEGSGLPEMDGGGQAEIYELPAEDHPTPRSATGSSNRKRERGRSSKGRSGEGERWSQRRDRASS